MEGFKELNPKEIQELEEEQKSEKPENLLAKQEVPLPSKPGNSQILSTYVPIEQAKEAAASQVVAKPIAESEVKEAVKSPKKDSVEALPANIAAAAQVLLGYYAVHRAN